MKARPSKDPLHGVTLEMMLNRLAEQYGWEEMGRIINIRCFQKDPSVKSSLAFLRRTPWVRKKVEKFYIRSNVGAAEKEPKQSLINQQQDRGWGAKGHVS